MARVPAGPSPEVLQVPAVAQVTPHTALMVTVAWGDIKRDQKTNTSYISDAVHCLFIFIPCPSAGGGCIIFLSPPISGQVFKLYLP